MSVTAAPGFRAAGISAGIKASGDPDLALVATEDGQPVAAAAVFTQNKSTAAPVVVTRAHLEASQGQAAAVILNSGNANAATGTPGQQAAERMCAAAATQLGCEPHHVLVCSTGLIGIPLDAGKIEDAAPRLNEALDPQGGPKAARAIMTTDTKPKQVVIQGNGFTVGGMAKGAAMLAPNMATMLAVLTTDAAVDPDDLRKALQQAVATTFNTLTVDGCTSTNDTVIVLANGKAGEPTDPADLEHALTEACRSLAEQMAADAEGATKVVRITVTGAATDDEAATAARKTAESQLCKCSWYGQDPYWGRIVSELGSAGVTFDPGTVSVSYGGITVASNGVAKDHDHHAVQQHMAQPTLDIVADLGVGNGRATVLTNDLTHAYIDENMGTS